MLGFAGRRRSRASNNTLPSAVFTVTRCAGASKREPQDGGDFLGGSRGRRGLRRARAAAEVSRRSGMASRLKPASTAGGSGQGGCEPAGTSHGAAEGLGDRVHVVADHGFESRFLAGAVAIGDQGRAETRSGGGGDRIRAPCRWCSFPETRRARRIFSPPRWSPPVPAGVVFCSLFKPATAITSKPNSLRKIAEGIVGGHQFPLAARRLFPTPDSPSVSNPPGACHTPGRWPGNIPCRRDPSPPSPGPPRVRRGACCPRRATNADRAIRACAPCSPCAGQV